MLISGTIAPPWVYGPRISTTEKSLRRYPHGFKMDYKAKSPFRDLVPTGDTPIQLFAVANTSRPSVAHKVCNVNSYRQRNYEGRECTLHFNHGMPKITPASFGVNYE